MDIFSQWRAATNWIRIALMKLEGFATQATAEIKQIWTGEERKGNRVAVQVV